MSANLNTFLTRGIDKIFFRIFAPTISKTVNTSKTLTLQDVNPDLQLETPGKVYLPTHPISYRTFGNWTFQTGELLISQPEKICDLQHLFADRPIALYVHGFTEDVDELSVRTILNAYLQRGDHTIMLLDWRSISQHSYYKTAIARIPFAGMAIAKFLDETFNGEYVEGLTLDRIHVISHSMGSQLSGWIGRSLTNGKLKRITALDPAGVVYSWLSPKFGLNQEDAEFVDAIHTDGGKVGLKRPCGHADFYPNGGFRFQPGCPQYYSYYILHHITLCSHWRSWLFYAESVVSDETAFTSCKAKSWKEFKNNSANSEENLVPMGFYSPSTARDRYFLQTNMVHPYSKGKNGAAFREE